MTKSLILFSAIMFFSGCDSGSGTESTDADTTISATGDKNPCLSKPECAPVVVYSGYVVSSVTFPCGWDKATGVCYTTTWCEPSVAKQNIYGTTYLRPESAVCPVGTSSYTYPANSTLTWAPYTTTINTQGVKGLEQIAGMPTIGPTIDATAYICTMNSSPVTITC